MIAQVLTCLSLTVNVKNTSKDYPWSLFKLANHVTGPQTELVLLIDNYFVTGLFSKR
jgi:hypothetical protein